MKLIRWNRERARILLSGLLAIGIATSGAVAQSPPWCISTADEQRIDELIGRMSLEQKLGQLTQQWGGKIQDVNPVTKETKQDEIFAAIREGKVGSLLGAHSAEYTNTLQKIALEESELKIPLILGNDVIHGYVTMFPIPLGEAASWDPELAERTARVAAVEARAAGTHWTFAPMVDICRDARWGRIAEGAGEDPYLGSAMAAARVKGFQGASLRDMNAVLACAKHYAAYGGAEAGKDYNTVDISEQTLREVYLPPFDAAVRAGAGSLMSGFNEISGMPATGSRLLLEQILRQEWGFRGFVVSDWNSVQEMVVHGYAKDNAHAAELAIVAGVDMDMSSFTYRTHLAESVKAGRVSESVIDEALRRVLRMKMGLGLFEQPYADAELEKRVTLSAEHREVARDSVRRSVVLLKNEGDVLPISDKVASLAVIGPLADNQRDMLGTWAAIGKPEDVVAVLEGIRKRHGNAEAVRHAKGCEIEGGTRDGFAEAVDLAKQSDMVVMVLGESEAMSGEGHSRAIIDLPEIQLELLKEVHATGKPIAVVLMNGRPMSIPWLAENVPAILVAWHSGTETGNGLADVLFGDYNPGGKLPATFPRHVGQCPIYYAHKNTGRPPTADRYTSKYIDVHWTPLYPFGHGLSYTKFEFANLKLSADRIGPAGNLTVSVDVKNVGDRAGDEVVQVYIRDLVASLTQPVKRLAGFQRIALEPGKSSTVSFTLGPAELGFYNAQMEFVVEPGKFTVWAGPSSAEGLSAEFEVVSE